MAALGSINLKFRLHETTSDYSKTMRQRRDLFSSFRKISRVLLIKGIKNTPRKNLTLHIDEGLEYKVDKFKWSPSF